MKSPKHSKEVSPEDAKWLAAAIDTDGSISLWKLNHRWCSPRIEFSNTHPAPVDCCRRMTGLGSVCDDSGRTKTRKRLRYRWTVHNNRDILSVLETVLPYLLVKKRRAQLLYAFCIIRQLRSRRAYTDIEWELVDRIIKLNRTGEIPISNEERLSSVASDQDRT